jgi:capsular polysaccharide transport system permease protein
MTDTPAETGPRRQRWWRSPLFLACVAIPTALAMAWFGLLASDVYLSESRFVVRGQDRTAPSALGLLLDSAAINHGTTEGSAAQSYLLSRDALAALNDGRAYARAASDPAIGRLDRFDPLGLSGSLEDLYAYYLGHVRVDTDQSTGITVLTVRAYRPETARAVNERLLRMAEATVNRMSERARRDLIATSQREVAEARAAARDAGAALARYRNAAGVVDPEKQAPIQYELVSKLQDDLIEARSDRRELGTVAPQSPQIAVLDARIHELQQRIDEQTGHIAGNRGSLAAAGAEYQRLALDADFSGKRLTAALASLQDAENAAQRQSTYLERIVEPSRPDKAAEPRRLRGIATTFVFGLVVWGVAAMLLAGVREHRS